MRLSSIATTAAALAVLACCQRAAAQEPDLDWIDWERLAAGEIMQRSDTEDGTVTINLAIEIDADWRSIWDVLTACEISPQYVPHVLDCRLYEAVAGGQSEIFVQTVKPAFFIPKFEHVFRLDYFPPERIEVRRVSGPVEILDGAWRLLPRPSGTIALVYSLTVNPGFPVPRFFVRNTLRRDLPGVLREVRARAEE
jgi:hypothetical protein